MRRQVWVGREQVAMIPFPEKGVLVMVREEFISNCGFSCSGYALMACGADDPKQEL